MAAPHHFFGLEIAVRSFSGARGLRIIHPRNQIIREHRHDWPLLTLPALGGYEEQCDDGVVQVSGPSVVLHPAGRCHANCIHRRGMETFSIEFDPAWLGVSPHLLDRTRYWIGGSVPLRSRALVRQWMDLSLNEKSVQAATQMFLERAFGTGQRTLPSWLPDVRRQLAGGAQLTARSIAQQLDLNPRWLAHAYRTAVGEGLQETIMRLRCEEAADLLRSTSHPIAAIAADCGFCDQSHLNRSMKRLIGRTPRQVRAEAEGFGRLFAPQTGSASRVAAPS